MIEEDRTIQLFGYTSDELGKGSHKKIVVVCEVCGKYRVVQKREYRDLCFTCSRTGENNYMWTGGEVIKMCDVCSKEFSTTTWEVNKGWGRFCSRECQSKWQSEARCGENGSGWKGGKVAKVCEVCGEEFAVKSASVATSRFCSSKCFGRHHSENMRGENNPLWKKKIVKICELCGKGFSVVPSQSRQKFCSRECYGKWRSENLSGENSPCFGETRSDELRKRVSATLRGIPYNDWESFAEDHPYCPKFNEACRESNRVKYDRRCFLSGTTEEENGQKLSVHHYDMNKAQGCDGHAWKLVPLCRKLHSTSHTPTWVARIQYLLNHVWSGA